MNTNRLIITSNHIETINMIDIQENIFVDKKYAYKIFSYGNTLWANEAFVFTVLDKNPHVNIIQPISINLGVKHPCICMDLYQCDVSDIIPVMYMYAKNFLLDMTSALLHLHNNAIIHRDFKLENILTNKDGKFVLCDMSQARYMFHNYDMLKVVTTYTYRAPEVYKCAYGACDSYDAKIDVWSFGICFLAILVGREPGQIFYSKLNERKACTLATSPEFRKKLDKVLREIKKRGYEHYNFYKEIIINTLEQDPAARWSSTKLFEHVHAFYRIKFSVEEKAINSTSKIENTNDNLNCKGKDEINKLVKNFATYTHIESEDTINSMDTFAQQIADDKIIDIFEEKNKKNTVINEKNIYVELLFFVLICITNDKFYNVENLNRPNFVINKIYYDLFVHLSRSLIKNNMTKMFVTKQTLR